MFENNLFNSGNLKKGNQRRNVFENEMKYTGKITDEFKENCY